MVHLQEWAKLLILIVELDDVAKSFLPLNRLDAGKGRSPSQRGITRFFL